MLKSQLRYREGRRARLKAELNFVFYALPVHCSCVYRRPEQRNQYLSGWYSVNQVDIDAAVMHVKQNQPQLHAQYKQALHQRNQELTCSSSF